MYLETVVIGYLGRDAVLQVNSNGKKVCNFSVAHTEKFKNSQGVTTERTTWIECGYWDAEKIVPYLKQGTMILAKGTPSVNAYVSKDGEPKASLRLTVRQLQLLGSNKKDVQPSNINSKAKEPVDELAQIIEPMDDLPF